jgi:uncharacterized SAM-binding protein YcdF (DUF218 family)
LTPDSIYRCLHAASLYRERGPCLVVACGGVVREDWDAPPLAHLMRDFLIQAGVRPDDIRLEDASKTTYENAAYCRPLLESLKIDEIVLVTDALSMPRAARCFQRQGLHVKPQSCCASSCPDFSLESFWPSPQAAMLVQAVWHEWLGLAWYRVKGRI